jgi:hypothetical protein
MFTTKVVEKVNTHILSSITFSEYLAFHEITCKNIVTLDKPRMAIWRMRIACWLTKATDTHTHTHTHARARGICYSHCFSTATMFARTRLNVTLFVHCLSCYNRGGMCLLRGTDMLFKYARVIFACKGLISCLTVLVLVVCMPPLLFVMSCGVLMHG